MPLKDVVIKVVKKKPVVSHQSEFERRAQDALEYEKYWNLCYGYGDYDIYD